jgi:hypothetical protein
VRFRALGAAGPRLRSPAASRADLVCGSAGSVACPASRNTESVILRSGSDGREVSRRERAPERVELIVGTHVIDGWRGLARSEGGIRLGQLEPGSAQTVCQAPVRFLSCCTPEIGDLLGDGHQVLTSDRSVTCARTGAACWLPRRRLEHGSSFLEREHTQDHATDQHFRAIVLVSAVAPVIRALDSHRRSPPGAACSAAR